MTSQMKKSRQLKKSAHSENNFTDKQSISLIENILTSHKRVMPKLDSIDKWPNIDGHIEIQNDKNNIIGRLNVQAKTLPQGHNLKFPCPIQFFSSCEIDPCLLFGVDNKNEKVYWLYFDAYEVKKIDFKNNKYTKTISFDKNKFFDKKTSTYIQVWEEIVKQNQSRFQKYDELKKAYSIISANSNKSAGKIKKEFINTHLFLDKLNNALDNEFNTIKNCFYPKTWKIGTVIYEYTPNNLSYALYPIPLNKNDIQIKEVDKNLHDKIQKKGLGFTGHFSENPLETRPREYAKEIVKSKTLKIIEAKLLKHTGNDFLAKEFIFAFIDKFHVQMGLKQKDKYSIGEIEKAFYTHLPLWLKNSHDILLFKDRNNFKNRVTDGRIRYYDPDRICEIREDEQKKIEQSVEKALKENTPAPKIPMGNEKIPFGLFVEFFNFLKQAQKEIERPYKAKDFSRLKENGSWVWSVFSKQDANHNLKIFFENILEVYNSILQNNFPLLKNELSFFGKADTILISWNVKDNYKNFQDGPSYKLYYLKAKSKKREPGIHLLSEAEEKTLKSLDFKTRELTFRKINYQIIRSSSILDFIYEDMPMLNFIYHELEEKLKNYFEK